MTFSFTPHAFGSACESLIAAANLCDLGPGTPNRDVASQLQALDEAAVFGRQLVVDHEMASCCISGLWLLNNFLDESHKISQEIHTTGGSYWHAIMHRREPDYGNSKYWCRRVGRHRIFERLQHNRRSAGLLQQEVPEVSALPVQGGWYQVLRLPEVLSEERWVLSFLDHGVLVQPGWFYDFPDEAWVVVSLLTPPQILTEGLTRIGEIVVGAARNR